MSALGQGAIAGCAHVAAGRAAAFESTPGKLEKPQIQRKGSVFQIEETHFDLVGRQFQLEETHFFLAERLFLFVLWRFKREGRRNFKESRQFCLDSSPFFPEG